MSDNMVGLRSKQDRPNLHYNILVGVVEGSPVDQGKTSIGLWQVGGRQVWADKVFPSKDTSSSIKGGDYVFALGEEQDSKFVAHYIGNMTHLSEGMPRPVNIYPCTDKGWRYEPKRMADLILDKRILWPSDPSGRPRKRTYLKELRNTYTGFSTVVGYTRDGTIALVELFGAEMISFPKPPSLVSTLVEQISDELSTVIDFFAGSGTTAHAVINLNREDGGERKYILVEMGDYFHTVLKPRIQKVVFSDTWRDGVPQNTESGVSHIFKYQRIESYEDALNNIVIQRADDLQPQLFPDEMRQDYMLRYLLPSETRDSMTLAPADAFKHPFDYKMLIQEGHESPQPMTVDLVETFHYLIGMHLQRIERHEHQGRHYVVSRGTVRTETGIERVVVIWRDLDGLDLEEEKDWVNTQLLQETPDRIYMNGESFVLDAEPVEYVFRNRMLGS